MMPPSFHEFCEKHFDQSNSGGWGWQNYIEDHVGTGPEALELFTELKALCEKAIGKGEWV